MKNGSDSYILATGKASNERLSFQHELLKEYSYDQLAKAGLSEGKVVCDIGCGNGSMTAYLAKEVGPSGHVYAIDISKDQLEVAEELIDSEGLNNVTFIQADISSTINLPNNIADIVYMRFVLMHLKHPEKAVANVKLLLKPGGVVASQEAMLRATQSSSTLDFVIAYYDALITLGASKGVDYNLGRRLHFVYEAAGYNPVDSCHKDLYLSNKDGKKFLLLSFREWKDKAIEADIISNDQAEKMLNDLENLPDAEKEFFFPKSAFALAYI